MMGTMKALGLTLRLGRYHLRVWKNGFEFGNHLGGRVFQFPWSPYKYPPNPGASAKE